MNDLISVARKLKSLGLAKEADELLRIVKTAGIPTEEWKSDYKLDQEFAETGDDRAGLNLKYTGLPSYGDGVDQDDPNIDLIIMDEEELEAEYRLVLSEASKLKDYISRNGIDSDSTNQTGAGKKLRVLNHRLSVIDTMLERERRKTGAGSVDEWPRGRRYS